MITKDKTWELHELLAEFADDLGETIDVSNDEVEIEILRPIYIACSAVRK